MLSNQALYKFAFHQCGLGYKKIKYQANGLIKKSMPMDYGDIMDLTGEQRGTWMFIARASCPYHNKIEEVAAW
jgi:hypothetical protein